MAPYIISESAEDGEVRVNLVGPGIAPDGRAYVFANTTRSEKFVEAVNFAYEQGFAAGMRAAERRMRCESDSEPMTRVVGRTPESLEARRETWWQRLRRRIL